MSMISDHKERTTPLSGTELAIIEDDDGLRGIRTELLRGLQGPKGETGPEGPQGIQGDPGPMPVLDSPGPIGGTTPDAGTFNQLSIKASTSASTLGPELIANGTFTGNADGWTLGQNWAYGANNVVLTLDGATEGQLSQTIPGIVSGQTYEVSWTQTHSVPNNGRITAKLGATAATALTLGATTASQLKVLIKAAADGDVSLSFTPAQASGGAGSISLANISVKAVTAIPATESALDDVGILRNESRITGINN